MADRCGEAGVDFELKDVEGAVHTLAEWATGVALALSVQGSVGPSCRKVYRPAT